MNASFRTKLFAAAAAVGILTALVTAGLLYWSLRQEINSGIEERLLLETRLVADLLVRGAEPLQAMSWDVEADRIASVVLARVTFIAADGQVLGDSAISPGALAHTEEHAHRPEIVTAERSGVGRARRYSTTVGADMLYVAVAVEHPAVRYVRLGVPAADIQQQLRAVVPLTLLAIAVSLPAALLLAWAVSAKLSARVASIAAVARRYAAGDMARPPLDYGNDELGAVARTLDGAVQELGRRLADLARHRARMEAILAGMVEGVLVVDQQGRIQLVNEAARKMLRIDDGALGRRHTDAIRHPDIVAELGAALRGAEPAVVELTFGLDPGRVFVARAAPARGPDGGGAVLVLHDITDLRRVDRIRRDFVANVSHELRTPLTAVRGYAEALLEETRSDEEREFVQIILRHTARMERLVGDLLRLARLDARQEEPEVSLTDVAMVVDGVIHDLTPLIEYRQARVHVDIDEAVRTIYTDPGRLHDVLRNLMENAITYSPEQGVVLVTARRGADGPVIEVADAGSGIPEADLERVFERFYRVDRSRSQHPGGTGIGLAIVKHLVELLGGRVAAANRPEGGAVFAVRLPLSTVPSAVDGLHAHTRQ